MKHEKYEMQLMEVHMQYIMFMLKYLQASDESFRKT